jgi:phage-related protein
LEEFKIVFFDKEDGTKPAKDFIKESETKMRAKLTLAVNAAREFGTELREPYSKHLEDGIFELRAKVGSNISRVLYFFFVGRRIILTHGFDKKTQKTPPSEIKRAKDYRAEYLNRKENSNE